MRFFLASVACWLIFAIPANAGIMIYTDEATFLAKAPVVSTETFDEFGRFQILGKDTVTVGGVYYSAPGNLWIAGIGLMPPISGTNDFGSNLAQPDYFWFGPDHWSTSLGFYLGNGAILPLKPTEVIVHTIDGSTLVDTFTVSYDTGPLYRGYYAPEGITWLEITSADGFPINSGYDNVSRGDIVYQPGSFAGPPPITPGPMVPEPSGLCLLGVGTLCLAGYAWRRRPAVT